MNRDTAFEAWVQRARDVGLEDAAGAAGFKLKRAGHELVGPCLACGGTDRWSLNPSKGVWNCRGAEGGNDGISLVMHACGVDFVGACEMLTGEPPPGRDSNIDHEAIRARRAEAQAKRAAEEQQRADAEERERLTTRQWIARLFAGAAPVIGTHAQAYLEARGLVCLPGWTFDLRFVPKLPYRGYATPDATDQEQLGEYPAMVAAIRDVHGEMIGLHRTYLDPVEPVKLKPPGDPKRNKAKKIVGDAMGGMIRLSEIGRRLALGEGIETTRAWFVLGRGGEDVSIAAAVSLGNLSGGATGTIKHPTYQARAIPNGEPDMARPGVIIPPDVDEVVLLGDGDSDGPMTRQRLVVAGRRFAADERGVTVDLAPTGFDFNDVLGHDEVSTVGGPIPLEQFIAETAAVVQPFRSRFGALSWEELDQPGPEHEYLIDGLLTVGDKSIIGGPSRSGKSFLSIDAGMAISRGVPFFGRPVVQGLVVYQAGEGARGVKKRLRAYRKHHGIPAGERIPFVLLQSRIDLYAAEGDTPALIEECKQISKLYDVPLRAFFIDTLATASPGADENSGKDMGAVMNNLDRIAKALPGTHVALVHHLNAAGTKLRGHSSIYANIDQVLLVTRNEQTGERTAVLDKQKDDEDGIHIKFRLKPVVVGYRERDQKEITSCVVYPIEGANPQPAQHEGLGFALRPNEAMVFQALVNAIAEHGEPAPADMPTIPAGVTVVRAKHWKDAFAAIDPAASEDDTPELIEKRAVKALKDYGPKLMQFKLIGRANPYVWRLARKVRGFDRDEAPARLPDNSAPLSDQDIADFVNEGMT